MHTLCHDLAFAFRKVRKAGTFSFLVILILALGIGSNTAIFSLAVVAFSVSLRKQEIAIRMALGSQRGGIVQLVLTSTAKLTLMGCALGVLGAMAASHFIHSFLFQVSPTDPFIYTSAALIMILLSLAACLRPATRAASVDPVEALRAI